MDVRAIIHKSDISLVVSIIERLRNENEDRTKTQDRIDLEYFGAKYQSPFQNID